MPVGRDAEPRCAPPRTFSKSVSSQWLGTVKPPNLISSRGVKVWHITPLCGRSVEIISSEIFTFRKTF